MPNTAVTVHLWDNDTFKVTTCGLFKEVVLPHSTAQGSVVRLCDDCYYISMDRMNALPILKAPPSPGEQALLDYFFPDA